MNSIYDIFGIWKLIETKWQAKHEQLRTSSKTLSMEMSDKVKKYLNNKFDELLANLATKKDVTEIKQNVSSIITKLGEQQAKLIALEKNVTKQDEQIQKMEAENLVLKRHVDALNSDQEQYSRRLCLRVHGVDLPPPGEVETSDQCLEKVLDIIEKMDIQVLHSVIHGAHQIGKPKKSKEDSHKNTQ